MTQERVYVARPAGDLPVSITCQNSQAPGPARRCLYRGPVRSRRRQRLVTAGILSFVPAAAMLVFVILLDVRIEGSTRALFLTILILPVTMYVIVVHRVRNMRVVIRQSLPSTH